MKKLAQIVLFLLLAGIAAVVVAGYEGNRSPMSYGIATGGSAAEGKRIVADEACGVCHAIPGIRGARGVVGPPLYFWSRRTYIAGELPNTPENLVRWIQNPRAIEPKTAMPNLGLTEDQARDVAAYLYTLR